MGWYEALARPLLFGLDPEAAHDLGLRAVASGLVPPSPSPSLPVEVFGVRFPNPVGLAAGFDKNAVAVEHWGALGFGFVEVGTVTRHPQPGNPKPRMFRLPEHRALINRLGFNNEGADAVARRLELASPRIPVGVNLGKSKVTPLEEAAEDYAYSFRRLRELGDYFVVNVSSPNTPGLRSLQDRPALAAILGRLREVDSTRPLLVKVAPDLEEGQLDDVASLVGEFGLAGVVATNTTVARPLPSDPGIEGGLSGAPLGPLADRALARLRSSCPAGTVLIGVGGVTTPDDARRKFSLGADLVQVYTGFVYGGPSFPSRLVAALAAP